MGRAKEYLQQIRKLDRMIDHRIKERDSLRNFDGVSGISYDGDPVQTSPDGSAPFERTVEKLIALEEQLDRLIDEFVETRNRIIGEIHGLKNTNHVDLLFKRYVEYKTFEQISVEMHYDYYYTCQMHGQALRDFEMTYNLMGL